MKHRRTLILVVTAIALAVYVRRTEPRPGGVAARDGASAVFEPVPAGRTELIEWSRGDVAIRAEKTRDDVWRITSPVRTSADETAIRALLDRVGKLKPKSWLSPAETSQVALKAFGLDDAAGLLKLKSADGVVLLRIGGAAPLAGQFYLERVGTKGIFVCDSDLIETLPATAQDWRDRSLLSVRDRQFDRVSLRGATAFEAEQDAASGLWRLVKPLPARADTAQIAGLLLAIVRTQVERFVSDAPPADFEALGLRPPQAEVVLGSGTNAVARLVFGNSPTNAPGLVYLWRPDATNLSLVPAAVMGPLRAPLAAFRDRRLIPGAEEASHVDFNFLGTRSSLQSEGTNWVVEGPPKLPADPAQARYLLQILGSLKIEDFPNDVVADFAPYGLDHPLGSLRLVWATNSAVEIQFGKRANVNVVYARRTDESGVYALRAADLETIPPTASQLRDLRFKENQVARVWARHGKAERRLEASADGSWRVASGASGAPFAPAMNETLHRIGALDTTRWLAPSEALYTNLPSFKDLDYEAEVELQPGSPAKKLRFRIVTENAAAAIALLNVDDEPHAWRIELPAGTLDNIRRDFGVP
jgi:Domain of unknown function (DUF4340)